MCVDSCEDPTSKRPAALGYLESLGVDPTESVRAVLATHWHDDHVRGLAAIVVACRNATVVMSAAVRNSEFFSFVLQQEGARGAHGSGVDELREVFRTQVARDRPIIWAKANVPLHPLPPGDLPRVIALSPSDDAFERTLMALISAATGIELESTRRYRAPESANGASVATWFRNGNVSVLLGADLECTANGEAGWDAVLRYCKPTERASAIKVPHHGSEGAHHAGVWSEILEHDPLTLLTPWLRGSRFIPTDSDLDRVRALSKNAYITALPSKVLATARKDPVVRKLHASPIKTVRGWGHIRARRGASETNWRVELSGDATRL